MRNQSTRKLVILGTLIAMNVVVNLFLRIEGMAPMSSVLNIYAVLLIGPFYTVVMAFTTAVLRMVLFGIPPLAMTGAVIGAALAGILYKWRPTIYASALGEIIGTGLIASVVSYPVMVWFTGVKTNLHWFVYTPKFLGATLIGTAIALLVYNRTKHLAFFKETQRLFGQK